MVPYSGQEYAHHGRYDLLPFDPSTMELVPTSRGEIPAGRRPIEGGYEENGAKLYHAVANVQGVKVPGKTGQHLCVRFYHFMMYILHDLIFYIPNSGGCNVSFGGSEIAIEHYELL